MPTYQKADETVNEMAARLIAKYQEHAPLLDSKVRIDFVFAFPDYNEDTGEPMNDALKKNGVKALGITRKLSLKDRAMGRGDAEIALDGDWWRKASEDEREALLDHELYHLKVRNQVDDLGRPLIKLRPHDVEVGWFAHIAKRHGVASQERIQARKVFEAHGQCFWPEIAGEVRGSVEITQNGEVLATTSVGRFSQIASDIKNNAQTKQ